MAACSATSSSASSWALREVTLRARTKAIEGTRLPEILRGSEWRKKHRRTVPTRKQLAVGQNPLVNIKIGVMPHGQLSMGPAGSGAKKGGFIVETLRAAPLRTCQRLFSRRGRETSRNWLFKQMGLCQNQGTPKFIANQPSKGWTTAKIRVASTKNRPPPPRSPPTDAEAEPPIPQPRAPPLPAEAAEPEPLQHLGAR